MGRAGRRSGVRGPALVFGGIFALLLVLSSSARADERSTADLDDDYLWFGPVGNAYKVDGEWDSAFGAYLAAMRVREHRALAAAGLALGAERYSARDGSRLWLEVLVGTRKTPWHYLMGLTLGSTMELQTFDRPHAGGTASLWLFLGMTPYVRFGWIPEAGSYTEIGVVIALPVLRR